MEHSEVGWKKLQWALSIEIHQSLTTWYRAKEKKNKIKKPLLNKFYINYVLKLHYFYILVK